MGNVARFPKDAFPYVLKHLRRKDGLCVRLLMELMPQEPTA